MDIHKYVDSLQYIRVQMSKRKENSNEAVLVENDPLTVIFEEGLHVGRNRHLKDWEWDDE